MSELKHHLKIHFRIELLKMHTPRRATYIKIKYHILLIMMVKWVLKQALTSFVVMIMRQKKIQRIQRFDFTEC